MSISILDKIVNGHAPWIRFFLLGFAFAGGYYQIQDQMHDHYRRLDAQWERMDRIDKRLDYIETKFDIRVTKTEDAIESLHSTDIERAPMMKEFDSHLDDLEHRMRAVESRKPSVKGPL